MVVRKHRNLPMRGFTLLEMVIVLGLMGLLIGGAATKFVRSSPERMLRQSITDVEVLSQKSRMLAIVQQTPYAITINSNRLVLGPWVESGYKPDELERRIQLEDELRYQSQSQPKFSPVREELSLSQFTVSVMRWGSNNWVVLEENDSQVWRFDPNGICEPLSIKLESDKGYPTSCLRIR